MVKQFMEIQVRKWQVPTGQFIKIQLAVHQQWVLQQQWLVVDVVEETTVAETTVVDKETRMVEDVVEETRMVTVADKETTVAETRMVTDKDKEAESEWDLLTNK